MKRAYSYLRVKIAMGVMCMCSSASAYDISLKVVEELDSLDIDAVKVTMQMRDSVRGVSVYTDGFGIAEMKNLAEGEYNLNLEKEGFYPIAALVNLKGSADLGTFAMTSTSTVRLDEVVIEGARVTEGVNKTTVRPMKETLASSLNSFDVLRKMNLNGLSVNPISGVLNIYGKNAVLQVDGLERGLDYVMSIDPSRIEKIEYTNNPTARYMQSGAGGVINIILKRIETGGSIYAQAGVIPYSFNLSGRVMATYNHKDSEFSVTVRDTWDNKKSRAAGSSLSETFKGENGYILERKSENKSPETFNSTGVNFTYQYQNREGWLLNAEADAAYMKGRIITNSTIITNGSPTYQGKVDTNIKRFIPSLNVYARKLGDAWKLEMITAVSMAMNKDLRNNWENAPEGIYHTNRDLNAKTPAVNAEVRFTRELPRKIGEWEVGVKEDYMHANNDYGGYGIDKWNHSLTYGYADASMEFGKFGASVNAGLGYEYNESDYSRQRNWQPSVSMSLKYLILDGLFVKINGDYFPSYPSISNLSNIKDPVQPGVISTGNDALKTSHTITGLIDVTYRKRNFQITVRGLNWHDINPKNYIVEYSAEGEFVHRPFNMKNKNWMCFSVSASLNRLFNHIDIYGQLAYNLYRVNNGYTIERINRLVPQLSINSYWGNFYVSASWYGEQYSVSGFSYDKMCHQINLSLAYSIPHWKFSLSLSGIGYGHDGIHTTTITSSPYYDCRSISRRLYTGNQIYVGISYDLQFGRSYQRRWKGLSGKTGGETTVKILDGTQKL